MDVREDVPRNRRYSRVDFVKLDAIAGTSISSNRPPPQANDSNPARAAFAAESYRQPHARTLRIVTFRSATLFLGPEDLRAVLHVAIGQSAQSSSRKAKGLLHPQRSIEIPYGHGGVALIHNVDPENLHRHHDRGHTPQQPRTPPVLPRHKKRQERCETTRNHQIEVESKQQRKQNADNKRPQRATRSEQKVEQRRLRRPPRPQAVSLAVAEEARRECFNQKEPDADAQRPFHVLL